MTHFKSSLSYLFATGFYSGLSRKAPGTFGSIAAYLVWFFILQKSHLLTLTSATLCSVLGIYAISELSKFEKNFSSKSTETDSTPLAVSDPSWIVIDEWAGVLFALIPCCLENTATGLFALVLFRLLDIFKPYPISYFDNLKSSLGIMLDDIVAGLITACLIYLCF